MIFNIYTDAHILISNIKRHIRGQNIVKITQAIILILIAKIKQIL